MRLTLNKSQLEAFTAKEKEVFYIAGLGTGKSFLLGLLAYKFSLVRGSVGLLAASTYQQLRYATIQQLKYVFGLIGLHENMHYVSNKQPPTSWGIKKFAITNNESVVTFRWGSYLILGNLTDYNKYRGSELDYILIDEYREVPQKDVRDVLLPRLRGACFKKNNIKHQIYYVSSPPDDPTFLLELKGLESSEIRFIHATTYENEINLPINYINSLKLTLDDFTFRREILAELITRKDNLFAYNFNELIHVKDVHYNPAYPVYLSFDFNINPSTCIVFQQSKGVFFNIIDEFAINECNIYNLCNLILTRYQDIAGVTGDASGKNRSTLSSDLLNHYDIIKNKLGLTNSQLLVSNVNHSHSRSFVIVNSILQHYPIRISSKCKLLIEDLKTIKMISFNEIDKSNKNKGHLLDCFRYAIHAYLTDFINKAILERL